MKICIIRQIIEALSNSAKSEFILECESPARRFIFNINSKGITQDIIDNTGIELNTFYKDVHMIPLEECKPVKLTEIRTSPNGIVLEKNILGLSREPELFLKLFRILKDQVVFIMQNTTESRVCYWIKGRLFYLHETSEIYELREVKFLNLYNEMPRAHVVLRSPLQRSYSIAAVFTEHEHTAKERGKLFKHNKTGVVSY